MKKCTLFNGIICNGSKRWKSISINTPFHLYPSTAWKSPNQLTKHYTENPNIDWKWKKKNIIKGQSNAYKTPHIQASINEFDKFGIPSVEIFRLQIWVNSLAAETIIYCNIIIILPILSYIKSNRSECVCVCVINCEHKHVYGFVLFLFSMKTPLKMSYQTVPYFFFLHVVAIQLLLEKPQCTKAFANVLAVLAGRSTKRIGRHWVYKIVSSKIDQPLQHNSNQNWN